MPPNSIITTIFDDGIGRANGQSFVKQPSLCLPIPSSQQFLMTESGGLHTYLSSPNLSELCHWICLVKAEGLVIRNSSLDLAWSMSCVTVLLYTGCRSVYQPLAGQDQLITKRITHGRTSAMSGRTMVEISSNAEDIDWCIDR